MLTGDSKNSIPVPHLEGKNVSLAALDLNIHLQPLWEALTKFQETMEMDQDIFKYMRYGPFPKIEDYKNHLHSYSSVDGLFPYVIEYKSESSAHTTIVGFIAYTRVVPQHRTCELGKVWLDPRYRRRNIMDEAIYLMVRHAFEGAKYRRVQWTCNNKNEASRKLALRTHFTFEGVLRNEYISKGVNRDSDYLSIIDSEWENVKKNLESKLFKIE